MENRNFKSGASASPPTAPVTPSNGYPSEGNPSTATPATLPGAFWFHKIGEELRAAIVGAGLTPTDTALTQLNDAINRGYLYKSVAGSSNVTLTSTEAHNKIINLTGVLTGNIQLIMPQYVNSWFIRNSTTGAYTITVIMPSGTGVVIRQEQSSIIDSDAVNIYNLLGAQGGFDALLSQHGWQKLPSGLILQWGVDYATTGGDTVLFPITFPSACFSLILGNASSTGWTFSNNVTTSGFTSYVNTGARASHYWLAIGY